MTNQTVTADKYIKKPVIIEAVRWCESLTPGEAHDIICLLEEWDYPMLVGNALHPETLQDPRTGGRAINYGAWINPSDGHLMIRTLEGDMRVSLGDWIIRGPLGEVYPCKPDQFDAAYERVEA